MTDQLEQQLRQLFTEEAQSAPTAVALAEHARRQARRSRRTHLTWGAGLLVAASVVGVAVLGGSASEPSSPPTGAPSAAPAPRPGTGPALSGPLGEAEGSSLASCAFDYTPATLAERAFAFDGTVTAVAGPGGDRAETTFVVNEWFSGGAAATVIVGMSAPSTPNGLSEVPPTYEIGTRLLISGEHLRDGATMADAVAWGCGFSRYYDTETAARWRKATS